MDTQIVKINPTEFGLEKSKANEITKGLATILKEKEILCEQYTKVIKLETTKENISAFRELRLQIRDNRTKGIEAWHKTNKEYFLRGGQFVDAIKRKESDENNRMEEQLLKGEKYFEILETERKAKLKLDREKTLEKYEVETEHLQLGEMAEEVWNKYFNGVKLEYEQRVATENKAEEERLRIEEVTKLHNKRREYILDLWQFAKPELKNANLGEISDSNWKNILESLKQKKADYDTKQEEIRKENERLQKEAEATQKEIAKKDVETARITKELQDKKDKEVETEKARQAVIESELSKGDKEKFASLIMDLCNLKSKYAFKSKKFQDLQISVNELIDKIAKYAQTNN